MGTATTPTKLSLARFAQIIGIHPLHFEGVAFTPTNRSPQVCDSAYQQYDWQEADRVSREQIAEGIAEAEKLLEGFLGFRLAPTWETNEWQPVERPYVKEHVTYTPWDIRGYPLAVRANWGYFMTPGVEAFTSLGTESIVWSDEDADGYFETGTVTVAVPAGTPACEIEAHYPEAVRPSTTTQIRPLMSVEVVGLVATLTFRRELTVVRSILDALTPTHADPLNDGDFLDEVALFRHYNDPQTQATLLWEPVATGCHGCGGEGCSICAYASQTACLHLRSKPRMSQVAFSPAAWDADTETFTSEALALSRAPDLVRLHYRAGVTADPGVPYGCVNQVPDDWARVISYLAVTLFDRPICDCSAKIWEHWREDFGVSSGGEQDKTYFVSAGGGIKGLDNPFGTRRGAMHAWKRIVDMPDVAILRSAAAV